MATTNNQGDNNISTTALSSVHFSSFSSPPPAQDNSNNASNNNNNNFTTVATASPSPLSSSPRHNYTSASFSSATYGDMFGASIHFWLESIVARCRCDRVGLFLPHPKHHTLVRVAVVGPTAQPVQSQNASTALVSQRNGDAAAAAATSAGPVTAAVLQTGIAANLSHVAQEDALDCPGTTAARTALIVPVKPLHQTTSTGANAAVGVIFAVNKLGGSQVFSTHDQFILISVAPSIAYMAETYPVDFAAHRFDPTPLYRIISQFKNTSTNSSPAGSSSNSKQPRNKSSSNSNAAIDKKSGEGQRGNGVANDYSTKKKRSSDAISAQEHDEEATQANLVLPEKPPQLVYVQSGAESMIPYVASELEEKTRENYNSSVRIQHVLSKKRKQNQPQQQQQQQQPASPTSVQNQPQSTTNSLSKITTPDGERSRIFDQSTATLEELALQHAFGSSASSSTTSAATNSVSAANSLSTAQQIVSVGEFVNRMEQCWRDAVSRTIATERELTLRNAQVVDAHSILHRKQRRLEILKDVLVETLEKKM